MDNTKWSFCYNCNKSISENEWHTTINHVFCSIDCMQHCKRNLELEKDVIECELYEINQYLDIHG